MKVICLTIVFLYLIGGVVSRSTRSTRRHGGGGGDTPGNCESVRPFFERKNITVDFTTTFLPSDISLTTCKGHCCSQQTEDQLRQQARADFHSLIHHHSRTLQGLLATTADALREAVTSLARQSENKTLILFEQVYRSMSLQSRPSINALYQAMVDYVSPSNTPDTLQQLLSREMLQERFIEFFTKLFPIAYHHAVNPHEQDFTEKFKKCLYEAMDEIQPFGDIPKQISQSVSKSLEAARVLVQALTLGKTVMDQTDSVLFSGTSPHQTACYEALLRMTYCPKCSGHGSSIQPCGGLCTNVMRGCLTEPASELDLAWSGYVDTVDRLVVAVDGRDESGLDAERAIRQLDTRISDAIMHAMENGPALDEKVRSVCGRSELQLGKTSGESGISFSGRSASSSSSSPSLEARLAAAAAHPGAQAHRSVPTQLHTQFGNFLASVVRSRTFYGTLADAICEEYPDRHCWNGERVGEYTKTVVDSSLTAQRYNPEFTLPSGQTGTPPYGNSNTSVLIDQLRHINQVIQSQLASTSDSGIWLADEALDGSGSGARPGRNRKPGMVENDDEDEDGRDDVEGSGSGSGPSAIDPDIDTNNVDGVAPKQASGSIPMTRMNSLLLVGLLWLVCGA
ncbi:division abnormally delayed protein [Chelonus insularis]|uniref:division abnormally delayed protein n=1 Tax=Chelonus insularis TaxID=460826 RepID=UPI00158D71C9|nr:division abnormally delayed protein [Chelonus insularis]